MSLFLVFILSTSIIILNRSTSLYISSALVHFIFFFLSLASLSVMALEYLFDLNSVRAVLTTLLLVAVISFVKAFLTWGGTWKTQTVIYRQRENPAKTIEYQMRSNRFAFGYRKQIVERQRIIPYFDIVKSVDTTRLDSELWEKTNEWVNEMGLPGEVVMLPD